VIAWQLVAPLYTSSCAVSLQNDTSMVFQFRLSSLGSYHFLPWSVLSGTVAFSSRPFSYPLILPFPSSFTQSTVISLVPPTALSPAPHRPTVISHRISSNQSREGLAPETQEPVFKSHRSLFVPDVARVRSALLPPTSSHSNKFS
jgi:hypothetical protein